MHTLSPKCFSVTQTISSAVELLLGTVPMLSPSSVSSSLKLMVILPRILSILQMIFSHLPGVPQAVKEGKGWDSGSSLSVVEVLHYQVFEEMHFEEV